MSYGWADIEYSVKRLLALFYDVQKLRIASEQRYKTNRFTLCPSRHMVPFEKRSEPICPICGLAARVVEVEQSNVIKDVAEDLKRLENTIYRELYRLVEKHPLYSFYLLRVKGVGPALSAYLIAVLNPARFDTVSKMYKYTGLHVVDGRAPRRIPGQSADYNPKARTMMFRLGESFRKVGGVYKYFYYRFLDESMREHRDWSMAHHINHARRLTVKLFLSHYYVVGRAIQGLPYRTPYPCLKHECIPPLVDYEGDYTKDQFYRFILERFSVDVKRYSTLIEDILRWVEEAKKTKEKEEKEQEKTQGE